MIQRFSLTKIFVLIALVAVSCLIIRQALLGAVWAKAIAFLFVAMIIWCLIHYALGLACYVVMRFREFLVPAKAQSPFATDTPAQQIIPPKNIELD
ncbi:hypothetical protein DTL42_03980 [Bremerella cremea]|uniref:Uncharacterized protein n=1 Tax=Bremerella cremea TaxID=1031537 RepID=A0A368KYG3_9BACT|nr:hypothetical protein [Bremerella cremea]RCS54312.1 hypothetical protein DTL42_03980 [Bremerella cremea]